jgi:hypothetical protein
MLIGAGVGFVVFAVHKATNNALLALAVGFLAGWGAYAVSRRKPQ